MKRVPFSVMVAFVASLFCSASAQTPPAAKSSAQPRPKDSSQVDAAVKMLFAAHRFEQAAISPDGKKVAWVETLTAKDGAPSGNTAIYVMGLQSKEGPARVSAAVGGTRERAEYLPRAEGSVAWAPDSMKIVFLSDAVKPGQLQLYIFDLSKGGDFRRLTSIKGFLSTPAWSPDGKTIALLFTENATRAAGPLVAETPQTGEIQEAVTEQRLALVDVATGKLRQISPADMYVYEYDWSPDGKRFVVSAAYGNGDNNWWIAQLYLLDATGGEMRPLYKPSLQIANPVWSPDGKHVAFIEGLMSDEGMTGGDIFQVNEVGGELQNLTPGMKASASWITWTPEGKILFAEHVEGDSGFATVDPASSAIASLWRGSEFATASSWIPSLSVARDGKTSAAIRSSLGQPPEVWAGPIGDWKPITPRNAGLKPAWGQAKSIHWKSDGYDVQGWLIYPREFDPSKRYPLVVHVHGGPSSGVLSAWPAPHAYAVALAAAGYFVLAPNPRGSYGQGEAFTRANVKDFGYGDFRDILAGVDEALRVAPIDPHRLGITGWSYGGYMAMWAVTQTNRFKAAMAGAGLSNWQSYYGENLIDQWMTPFFGASVYDDPAVYAKSSPMSFIRNVKTPTLILVGDSDGEVPAPQSWEFWHALKSLGVETKLVVYEHEGHLFAKPAHQRDVIERTLAWFNAHLQ